MHDTNYKLIQCEALEEGIMEMQRLKKYRISVQGNGKGFKDEISSLKSMCQCFGNECAICKPV